MIDSKYQISGSLVSRFIMPYCVVLCSGIAFKGLSSGPSSHLTLGRTSQGNIFFENESATDDHESLQSGLKRSQLFPSPCAIWFLIPVGDPVFHQPRGSSL